MTTFKLLAALALVASPLCGASGVFFENCGWLDEACCANNVCKERRSACWEGTCMPCGKDGKPVCPTGPKCDEGTREKDDFCVHANAPAPPPPPRVADCGLRHQQCCADNVCTADRSECWEGTCMQCGVNGKPQCTTGRPCDPGNVVNKDGWCSTFTPPHPEPATAPLRPTPPLPSAHCGWRNEQCCAGNVCKAARTACWEGTCMSCGKDGKPVCPSGRRCDAGTVEKDDFCVHDSAAAVQPPMKKKSKKGKKGKGKKH